MKTAVPLIAVSTAGIVLVLINKIRREDAMKLRYLKTSPRLGWRLKMHRCGRCTEVCPHGVFGMTGNKAGIEDKDSCMECGACAKLSGGRTVNTGGMPRP